MAKREIKNLKIQPQSIEAEQAVLGSMLTSPEAVNKAQEILSAESFYVDAHKKIFEVMIQLFNNNEPIDVLSVDNKLKENNQIELVGGSYFITGLPDLVPSTANIEYYAKIVLEKASLRNLINISNEISFQAYENSGNFENILDESEQKIFALSQGKIKNKFQALKPVLQRSFERLDEISKNPGSVTGVPSGLRELDKLTSGFQPGELIIVAGRPSMGKTALALSFARNAAIDYKIPVGIFSLEMSNDALAMRLLTAESRVDSHLVRSGILPKEQWRNLSMSVGNLADAPIFLDDTPAMGITELRAKSRRLKSEKDVKLLVVDYLQLMKGPQNVESRQQEISQISQSLKALAKEINVPVLALSQLSRAPEARSDHRPVLSDLRESGAIEQDADLVMFLYRKWVYSRDDEDKRKAEIIISKQRNGPTGTINATFIDNYAKFENTSLVDVPSE
ncbi:MAG: replicative DNA helicase [Candidatus Marinimicrobia bacterium]|nr:replicative DNA helicase [Candidatus Neomarinimicrobiota bacterium]|tara:strand:- start:10574 stop:11926 length:1353 start_codon:yes stop_codon:yes gene_type:complete